jgi:hypothetical protein
VTSIGASSWGLYAVDQILLGTTAQVLMDALDNPDEASEPVEAGQSMSKRLC